MTVDEAKSGMLRLHILGSGSKGNCALVEGPQGLIMIDDGFSRREVLKRMHELGLSEQDVRALLLTHEHTDHVSGISVWCRSFDVELFASVGTPETRSYLDALPFCEFIPGISFEVAGVTVQTFPTSHDVVNPVGFRFECAGDSIGFATDTGILTDAAAEALDNVRILALESNHDVPMLRTGSYPRYLQDRIISPAGHLSNAQAAEAAAQASQNAGEDKHHRCPWRSFPYGVVATLLFFVLGFWGSFKTSWLIFLTIPLYHWLANIMDGALAREERTEFGGGRRPSRLSTDNSPASDSGEE